MMPANILKVSSKLHCVNKFTAAKSELNPAQGMGSPEPDSHIMTIQISPTTGLKSERLTGKLNLNIQEDVLVDSPIQEFHFEME